MDQSTQTPKSQPSFIGPKLAVTAICIIICVSIINIMSLLYFRNSIVSKISKTVGAQNTQEKTVKETIINKDYKSPYPVVWYDDGMKYSLTSVSYGRIEAPANLKGFDKGEVFHGMVLKFKVLNQQDSYTCISARIRRVNDDEEYISPLNRQIYLPDSGGCQADPFTTHNIDLYFQTSDDENRFYFDTRGDDNERFSVRVLNNQKIEVIPMEE